MTREEAIKEARRHAVDSGLPMVVTYNRYAEEADDAHKYGYFPAGSVGIFQHEKIVETIRPDGSSTRAS